MMIRFVKIILLACTFLAGIPLQANPVSESRALDAARAFFQRDRNVARRLAPVEPARLAPAPLTKAGEAEPAYYIFNRTGGGFVIIAGDDACAPVLAYSFDNAFGTGADMPDNLREWLEELETLVGVARSSRIPRAAASWDALSMRTKAGDGYQPAVKLNTPAWNQNEPFNRLTPIVNGKHTVIGCVPLAMGMVMRFFGYPASGSGSLPSYSYTMDNGTTCSIDGFELGHAYEWDKIKFNYKEGYTEEEGDAVARLVYDCGVAVQAKFDESTSASTQKMAGCAVDFFGFDAGAYYYKRELFSDAEWMDMLKAELQERPILYSAKRDAGGHAFLVDGYDEAGNVSVNWGWGGTSNGYYAISAFTPSENRQYIYNHGAVFGLKPKESDSSPAREYLFYQAGTASSGTEYNGLTPSETIRPGHSFSMKAGFLHNGGIHPFSGEYCIVLCDEDGQVKEEISNVNTFNELKAGSSRGYPNISCVMKSYPLAGDKVCLIYRSDNWPAGVWEKPLYDLTSGLVAEIPVTDDTKLEEVTSFNYNKTSGVVLIETKDLVDWRLEDASGQAVTDGVTYQKTTLKIETAGLAKGTYKLTLKRFAEQVTLTLKMGTK